MELPVRTQDSGSRKISYGLETKSLSCKLCNKWDLFSWVFFSGVLKGDPKFILRDVNCEARAGEITAIAGPSGAGKTTLLEILAGKNSPNEVSGQVMVNQKPMNGKEFRILSGYVTQDDALFPLLTVEETLIYSSLLRFPGTRKESACRAKRLMKELGLDHVAGSRIGGGGSRTGVSGGERRRVSIGVELVHDPSVVLIDEPTTGLDSASALQIVTLLRTIANQGKTIVLTIHQPGFRILELLDRVVLLSNGCVLHNGPMHLLEERLRISGHHIPRRVNVLEYTIDVLETLIAPETPSVQAFCEDPNQGNIEEDQRLLIEFFTSIKVRPVYFKNSRVNEVLILGQRFCKNIFRTKQLFAARTIQSLVAGFLLGTIFLNSGRNQGQMSLQTQTGFFAFSLTFLLTSTTEGLPIFLQERRILMREISRGAYRVSSYVLSNTLVFIPFLFIVTLLYSTPVYWLVGLRREIDGFLYFSLVVFMVVLMSNSFVACFSALVPNFIMGTSVIAGLMGSFFLFSGYFISKNNMPGYWIFMHYLSLFKYPFECFLINEYGGEPGSSRCVQIENGHCILNGSGFLKQQGLMESQKWSNLAVMMSFIIGYRAISLLILWFRCYWSRN